jgi:PAS domain S-box-containing protein
MRRPNLARTVSGRLVLLALAVEILMLTVLVFNSIRMLQSHMTEQAIRQTEDIVPVLAAALTAPLAQQDNSTVQAILDEIRIAKGIEYAVVEGRSGVRVAGSGWPSGRPLPRPTERQELSLWRIVPRYDVASPITSQGQALGTMHFGFNLQRIVAAKRLLSLQSMAIAGTEVVLSFVVLISLGFWITRHLRALTEASGEVAAGNLTPPPMWEGEDDVGRLGAAFNAMSRAVADRIGALSAAKEMAEMNAVKTGKLNRALEEQQSLLRSTIQSTGDLIFFKDLEGKYLGANRAFEEYVGRPAAAIAGATDHDIFPQEVADFFREQDRVMLESGAIRSNEEWITYPDERQRLVETMKSPIRDAAGKTIGLVGIARDITERKQAESRLREAYTNLDMLKTLADEANRAKGVFLATMSHELRTPLAHVLGMAELLRRTTLTDQQRRYVEKIRTSGDALLSVIGDILDLSKIDSGSVELDERAFLLDRDVVYRVQTIIGAIAGEKGLEMRVTMPESLPPLRGDDRRLTQVLLNLLSNAVKFTEKGMVELEVRVSAQEKGRVSLSLVVRDTGIGIAPEQMGELFLPFRQADASTTRRYGGSGLGLAISSRIIELMGGEIGAESVVGAGSVFTARLSLPVATAADVAATEDSVPADERSVRFVGVRVLVVEDQPINQEILGELLRLKGIEVDLARDGREAMAKVCGADSYDLVFMDIRMPVMDGYEATRKLRAREATKGSGKRPIVGLTAHALDEEREKGLAAGMDDYLTKPLDPRLLDRALLKWLPEEKRVVETPQGTGPAEVGQDMALPGLDVLEGLQRVNGNQALYLKLLKDFVANFGDMKTPLLKELRTDRWEDTIRLVHSVKGLSGNLGGKGLMAAASSLEKALREMEGCGALFSLGEPLRAFIDRHEAFLSSAAAFIARQAETEPAQQEMPEGMPEELPPLLEELRAGLAAEEPRPCKAALAALGQRRWPENVEKLLREIRGLVDRYRLAEARALLEGKGADLQDDFGRIGGANG